MVIEKYIHGYREIYSILKVILEIYASMKTAW